MFLTFLLVGAGMPSLEFNFQMSYVETVTVSGVPHVRMLPWGIADEKVDLLIADNDNGWGYAS